MKHYNIDRFAHNVGLFEAEFVTRHGVGSLLKEVGARSLSVAGHPGPRQSHRLLIQASILILQRTREVMQERPCQVGRRGAS
jgi:hypothetical protein